MKISDEQIENLIKTYKAYICPLCHADQWLIGDTIYYLNEYHGKKIILGGSAYPVFTIACAHCGNTLLVNALIANVISKDDEKNKDEGVKQNDNE